MDLATDGPHPGEVKQAWVYRQIRDGILGGALPAGARLPSTRSLAERWQLARMTVEAAYDQLRGEGYPVSAVGSGTYVSTTLPDRFVSAAAARPPARGGTAALLPLPPQRRRARRRSARGWRMPPCSRWTNGAACWLAARAASRQRSCRPTSRSVSGRCASRSRTTWVRRAASPATPGR